MTALIPALAAAVAMASSIGMPAWAGEASGPQRTPARAVPALDNEALIDAQLAAYDRRDVEAFLAFYSDDAKLFRHPGQVTESGKEALRARYRKSFLNRDVRAVILKRMVFDRFVIDHERLTGHPDGVIEAIAVYEIRHGRIVSVTFYNP